MVSFNASIETPYVLKTWLMSGAGSERLSIHARSGGSCQSGHASEARRLFGGKEHCMGDGNTQFDGRPFLVDTGGAFAAVDDLSGGEADCVQILRPSKRTSHNARLGRLVGRQMDVIRADHDDEGAPFGAIQRIGELTQFGMDRALANLSGDEVGLTHKLRHEARGWKMINDLRGIHLLEYPLIQDSDTVRHGEGFV